MPPRGPVAFLSRPTPLLPPPRTLPLRPFLLSPPLRSFSFPSFKLPGFPTPPTSPPQTIQVRRTFPYPAPQVYTLIADVDSYAAFLPFCTASRVTRWTLPDRAGRRWPTRADLTVGWGPVTESYTSRLYCVPGRIVEAVSGDADTAIPEETLREHGLGPRGAHAGDAGRERAAVGVFDSLMTRWALQPVVVPTGAGARGPGLVGGDGKGVTEVTLSIRFRFSNPAYGLAVGRIADDLVETMAEAFEKRAREIYGRQ